MINMGDIKTINETDFLWVDGEPKGISKAVLYDCVGTDHLPAVVGASLVQDDTPIGYITSKHVASSPHTILSVGFTGWPIYRNGDTLLIEILTPAHISENPSDQKNAWLFNYPPARDVVQCLSDLGVDNFLTLTSTAFDASPSDAVVCVKGEEIGTSLAPEAVQPLWGWFPAFLYTLLNEVGANILLIPAHGARQVQAEFDDTAIEDAIEQVGKLGFNTENALERAKSLYGKASSEASEAMKMANEMISKMMAKTKKDPYSGGMFQ